MIEESIIRAAMGEAMDPAKFLCRICEEPLEQGQISRCVVCEAVADGLLAEREMAQRDARWARATGSIEETAANRALGIIGVEQMSIEEIDKIIEATANKAAAITELLSQRAGLDKRLTALGHTGGNLPVEVEKPKRGRPVGAKNKKPYSEADEQYKTAQADALDNIYGGTGV